MKTVTDVIRSLRSRGLTQSEIARQARIPQSRLSRWEAGKAPESVNDGMRLLALDAELTRADAPKAEA